MRSKPPRFTAAYTAALLVAAWSPQARCEQQADQPAPRVDSAAEARDLLDRAASAYRAMRSYSDAALLRHEMHWAGNPDAQAHESRLEFWYGGPARFVLRSERGGVYCDGGRLWLHDADLAVYTESPAPDPIPLADLDRRLPSVHLASHPIARLLLTNDPADRAWNVEELRGWQHEPRAGAPGHRVRASGWGDIPGQGPSPMTLWFAGSPPLLGEIGVDLTTAFRAANLADDRDARPSAARVLRVGLITTLVDVRVDEPIPAERFTFSPSPADRRVDEISSPHERTLAAERTMVGRPAPPIERPLLDGGAFSARGAGDRVLVLYFWDTGSPASVGALARTAALAERLRAQAVTVLGVNQDRADAADTVRRVVAREGATPSQLLDAQGDLARALSLSGIPSTVLIDRGGIVRGIYPGPLSQYEDEVAERARALAR